MGREGTVWNSSPAASSSVPTGMKSRNLSTHPKDRVDVKKAQSNDFNKRMFDYNHMWKSWGRSKVKII